MGDGPDLAPPLAHVLPESVASEPLPLRPGRSQGGPPRPPPDHPTLEPALTEIRTTSAVRGRLSDSPFVLTGNTVATEAPTPRPPGPTAGFRPEIEGLRALAVLLVVGYHVWGSRVSGGVDVFLLLTGFLLVASTTRRMERTGSFGTVAFWKRLAGRLLPTTALVLVAAIGAALVLLPVTRWEATVPQWFAAALFYENWQLAVDSVDYAAARDEASPVQHLWSLSVQAQFYLVLPVLGGLSLAVHRLTRIRLRALVAGVLVLVLAGSLSYAVVTTGFRQPFAYFDTGARLWEFALGGLLALALPYVRAPRAVRVLAGWVGVAGLVSVGGLVDVTSLFPGPVALWPLGAAALVLLAGTTGSRFAADRVLTSRLARHLGVISFALYLWHWPVFVFYLVLTGRPVADPLGGLLVVGASLLLAEASHALVERPVLDGRRRDQPAGRRTGGRRFGLVVLWLVPALSAATVFAHLTEEETRVPVAVSTERYPGATALTGTVRADPGALRPVPSPAVLADDWVGHPGCEFRGTEAVRYCETTGGGEGPARSVLLVGDSHTQQLGGVITEHAAEQGFAVRTALMGACPLTTDPEHIERPEAYRSCLDFNQQVLREVAADPPDLVVTVGSRSSAGSAAEEVPDGYVDAWRRLTRLGIPVLVLRDNPRWTENPVECVLRDGAEDCGRPVEQAYRIGDPLRRATADLPDVTYLDVRPLLCDERTCPPRIGNVYVYMDDNHVSQTYVRTMAQAAEPQLRELIPWWR